MDNMLKPIGERVLIKQVKKNTKGLELAEIKSVEFTEGEVVALGIQVGHHSEFTMGTIVIISKYSGEEYKEGEEVYKIVEAKHILAVK